VLQPPPEEHHAQAAEAAEINFFIRFPVRYAVADFRGGQRHSRSTTHGEVEPGTLEKSWRRI
jgi:hypothetical protein